jgi:hypothetical protein
MRKINISEKGDEGGKSKKRSSSNSSSLIDKTVTFINHNGRMFTSEMDLPENMTMEAVKSIGKTVLESIDPKGGAPRLDRLAVLAEIDDDTITIGDVKRIVIFDTGMLDSMTKG